MIRWLTALVVVISLDAESARNLTVERRAPPLPDNRTRWAVVVGVSSYKYLPPFAQLKFAHRDAEEFASLLRSGEGGGFPAGNVRLLTNASASVGGIRAAMHSWLPRSAAPDDIVYIFFAGHAVTGERGESYFVAHDSDPQNLHATAIPFREINEVLTSKLRAASVVMFADACHAGEIGWTNGSAPAAPAASLETLGPKDRSVLKVLASRPTEQSFEDERWGGGHGVFTFAVLNGLRGAAEREPDGVVRVSELIEYIARVVPDETGSKQNPRVAGNFEAAMPMASLPGEIRRKAPAAAVLHLSGPPNTAVYLDRRFRGTVRPGGDLLIDANAGSHTISVDLPGMEPFEQPLTLLAGRNALDLRTSPEFALAHIKAAIRAGAILGANGAWEQFRAQKFAAPDSAAAAVLIMGALEDTGMECVSDYVQSTTSGLKRPMFLRAAEAFVLLGTLRPNDKSVAAKALFCRARAQIADGEFAQAAETLDRSLALDPDFACSYNALGVALSRLGRNKDARAAFAKAGELTPAWALPPLQIAQQLIGAGNLNGAVPYLEKAAKLNPKAVGTWWSLARVHRLLRNGESFLRAADAAIAADRNYAPVYSELGQFYETVPDPARAAQAYDTYLLLAPNFADSTEVRKRVQALRSHPSQRDRRPPTLRRNGEGKQ